MVIDTYRQGLRFRLFKGTHFAACGKVFLRLFAIPTFLPAIGMKSATAAAGLSGVGS